MQKIMEMLWRIYAGRMGRGAMLRPVLLRSFWVLLLGVLAFYLLYRDSSVLSPEKKEFILAGNTAKELLGIKMGSIPIFFTKQLFPRI